MLESTLISILIICLIFGLLYWAVTLIPIPGPFKQIATVAIIVVGLILVISKLLAFI